MRSKRHLGSVALTALLAALLNCPCEAKEALRPLSNESREERDARMEWWRDARFGMFVHWGLYAIPAGEWNGKPVDGIGEWIMQKGRIPYEEYKPLANEFDPVDYDPQRWAKIAADAGMKYVVITSKHHDGFCLFDTEATEWDVVDATPYGKDLLSPLAKACREHGIKFCTYYSIMDWSHPSQRSDPESRMESPIDPDQKDEYIAYMKQQLKELLDSCDPDVLWFDGEWVSWWTEEDGRDLYAYLRELKPSLIINNRVGKGRNGMEGLNRDDQSYVGDFGTPEQQIPATGVPGVDWESCMTMNDTWGFKKNDDNWKSTETLVKNLVDIVSKGGNFLLNVGPTASGEIPDASVSRLAAIGDWMDTNAESIYGAEASPIERPEWGRCTSKPTNSGYKLYLHVFDWPADGELVVKGKQPGSPRRCSILGMKKDLDFESTPAGLVVQLPSDATDSIDTVIEVDYDSPTSSGSVTD